jgi:DUF4097 and DUF4098 domain-containing protein YvlB
MRSNYSSAAITLTSTVCIVLQSAAFAEAREEITRSFDRVITVSGSPTLLVDHRLGDLRVRAHARNDLRIQATIHVSAASRSDASVLAERIQIDVQESPGTISVTTRYPDLGQRDGWRGRRDVSFSVDYELLVPDRLPVNVRNRFGDVDVSGMKGGGSIVNASGRVVTADGGGRYAIENRFGAIEAMRLSGDVTIRGANGPVTADTITGAVNISNRFGNVNATTIRGDAVIVNANGSVEAASISGRADLSTRFGRIEAQGVKGGLRVSAANGAVRVADIDGPVYLKTSFGPIDAERVRGELIAENANGSVSASSVGGAARVSTSFGPVVLREVDGRVDVTNRSGSVEAWPTVRAGTCHDVLMTTSFSPMVVHLPDTGYAVAARTTFGSIQTEMPITASGSIGGNAVSGTIGRGGCALQLHNASGNIRIARATAAAR